MADIDIAVVGAGMVGVSSALWAQLRGHRVVLVDPAPPGSGTSAGNACTIATYACLPVNDPSVFRDLPALLFGRGSPLALSWTHALRHPLWMLAFLANCRSARSREISRVLADLLSRADAGLNPLIEAAGAEDLVEARGQLQVWSTAKGARGAEAGLAWKRSLGVPFEEIEPDAARQMEPGLALPIARAVHHTGARQIRDPEALVQLMHARFTALGGETVAERATAMAADDAGVTLTLGDGQGLRAARAVLAAGAFSRRIPGGGAERLPLGTERGYHLMFAGEAARVTRPVGWAEGGFYAVPTARGLRLAGTVEIAALGAPPNRERLAYLARRGAELLGPLPARDAEWLGFRPTMPDALPVLGPAPGAPRILHAFGHQHLGLTLGGLTGRIIADLCEGWQPNLALEPIRPDRRFF
ncbi:NAD(P)/FAD-dependent oxidoreductase [Vannielia litorea]|uniref:NAD(P)/FAD-dependent oxidoreductase n=1 Tax=Vannielia litorea TaxID=1217970 RepID=UPI001BD0EE47|nr:FAD-binding oxidoreductase [Vannielia litorea]